MITETWPLVGRAEELGLIVDVLTRSDASGVVVGGAAGVGKTRLVREALDGAERAGFATRWATASHSARSIPFGALAHLLPPAEGPLPQSPLQLMRELGRGLTEQAGERKLVFGVDDAHLLDDASAAFVQQLVVTQTCVVVLTVRSGEPEPDAIVGLWKERTLGYLEVQPLSSKQTEALMSDVLGGDVDGATLLRLWEVSRGNPLFLRELLIAGLEKGLLVGAEGPWRWNGPLAASPRLVEIVDARLGELSVEEHKVLELVAIGEPLELRLLERISLPETLEALERRGLLALRRDRRRLHVVLAHPVYGEVLRVAAPALGTRAGSRLLATVLEGTGSRRRDDALRSALWRLDAGVPSEPQVLIRAARSALAAFDAPLAERLARAALDADGGGPAAGVLGAALSAKGLFADAEALFALIEPTVRPDADRLALATARATNLFWGMGLADEAARVALQAEAAIESEELRAELAGLRAAVLFFSGRPNDALDAVSRIIGEADVSDRVGVQAALAATPALAVVGRCGAATALVADWYDAALRLAEDIPAAPSRFQSARVLALWLAGRLDESETIAEEQYRIALQQRSPEGSAMWPMILGAICLTRGRLRSSVRWLRASAAQFRELDPIGHLPWCLAFLAQALAHAGDADAAEAAIAEADAVRRPGMRIFEVGLDCARAWAAAARGELSTARDWACHAAEEAEQSGQLAFAVIAFNDLARLGKPAAAAGRLEALARSVEGPFAPACAAYAAAAACNDGVGLDAASAGFELLGAQLLAADAAAAAARAHDASGRPASAGASSARARALLAQCEGPRPSTVTVAARVDRLTDRESEVTALAANGLSNVAIASRLVLSVRTVENHLQHAYGKLGIARRGELARALGAMTAGDG
jgi:DNA-binding CsgD family transcriptional regulator